MNKLFRVIAGWRRRARYRIIRQYDASDCGPAAVLSVLRFWGGNASLPYVRELARTDARGCTLFSLVQAARRLGLTAEGATGTYEELLEQRFPIVAHVIVENGLRHYVVVYEASATRLVIGDPAKGIRTLSRAEFEAIWVTRAVILLDPTPALHRSAPPHWIRWLSSYAARDSAWLQQILFLGVAYTAFGLLTAAFVQLLLDRLIPSRQASKIVLAGGVLLGLQVARAALGYARQRFMVEMQYRVGVRVTADFLAHLFALPPQFFFTRRKGDLTSRVHDTIKIQQALLVVCGQAAVDVLVVTGSVLALCFIAPRAAWLATAFVPLFIGFLTLGGRSLTRRQRRAIERYAAFESCYIDSLSGADEVRSFGGAASFSSRATEAATSFQRESRGLGYAEAALSLFADLAGGLLIVGALAWGGVQVIQGQLRVGQLMAAYSLIASILPASIRLVTATISLRAASVAVTRLFDLLLVEPEAPSDRAAFGLRHALEVRDASFTWPDGTVLLDAASFTIRRGEVTGLLGPSGSGKSTLVRILQRKLPLDRGTIAADGVPLQDLDLESVRRGIAAVPESVKIFNGSIAENILVGRAGVGLEDVSALIRRMGLEPVMRRFDAGLLTNVGEDARQFSSGERQIIGLLRALVDEPHLLVVDEGVSAIDVETAGRVLDIVVEYAREHAVLLISHNATTFDRADRLYEIKHGRVLAVAGPALATVGH